MTGELVQFIVQQFSLKETLFIKLFTCFIILEDLINNLAPIRRSLFASYIG